MRQRSPRLYLPMLGMLGVLLVCSWGCGHLQEEGQPASSKSQALFFHDMDSTGVALASYQEPTAFLQHPDVQVAVKRSQFPIYEGGAPPQLKSTFAVAGSLTASSTRRETGAALTSSIFLNTIGPKGQARFGNCEKSKLVSDGYVSITGGPQGAFTLYVTLQTSPQCRVFGLFSGQKAAKGWDVKALVIREQRCGNKGVNWEHSRQTWTSTSIVCKPPKTYRPPTRRRSGCPGSAGGEAVDPSNPWDPMLPPEPPSPVPTPGCSASSPNCPNPGTGVGAPKPPLPPGTKPPSPPGTDSDTGTPGGAGNPGAGPGRPGSGGSGGSGSSGGSGGSSGGSGSGGGNGSGSGSSGGGDGGYGSGGGGGGGGGGSW